MKKLTRSVSVISIIQTYRKKKSFEIVMEIKKRGRKIKVGSSVIDQWLPPSRKDLLS